MTQNVVVFKGYARVGGFSPFTAIGIFCIRTLLLTIFQSIPEFHKWISYLAG